MAKTVKKAAGRRRRDRRVVERGQAHIQSTLIIQLLLLQMLLVMLYHGQVLAN